VTTFQCMIDSPLSAWCDSFRKRFRCEQRRFLLFSGGESYKQNRKSGDHGAYPPQQKGMPLRCRGFEEQTRQHRTRVSSRADDSRDRANRFTGRLAPKALPFPLRLESL
jgi:hypothetical protein